MTFGYIQKGENFFEKYTGKKEAIKGAVRELKRTGDDEVHIFRKNCTDIWFTVTTHKPEAVNQIQVKLTNNGFKVCRKPKEEGKGEEATPNPNPVIERAKLPTDADIGPAITSEKILDVVSQMQDALDQFETMKMPMTSEEKLVAQTEHPDYYGGADNPYELMKVFFEWGIGEDFCKGCVIKYLIRAGKKIEDGTEDSDAMALKDMKKALMYTQFLYDWMSKNVGY